MKSKPACTRYAVALLAAISAQQLNAAAITWDNGGGDQLWSNNTNWNPDGAASGNDLTFGATGVAASGTVTNIVDANISVNSLAFTNTGAAATSSHTTQINNGVTLTIAGAVANALTSASTTQSTDVFTGAGSLVVGSGNSATTWTVSTGTNTSATISTLDMSGLASFTFNGGAVSLGTGVRNAATVSLATTNSITSTGITLGGNTTTGGGLTTLNLGQTNTVKANTITVGGGRSSSTLQFLSTLTNPTVTITDTAGTGAANLNICSTSTNASGIGSGTVDFSLGTVTATLGTVTIGTSANGSAGGSGTGTLTFGAGTLSATAMNVGNGSTGTSTTATGIGNVNMTAASGTLTATTVTLGKLASGNRSNSATGTFNQNGGTAVITTLKLSDGTSNTGTGMTITGTYNLAGGTLKAGSIAAGTAGSGSATYNRAFNWTGGTIQNLNSTTDLSFGSGITFTTTGSSGQTFSVDSGRSVTVSSGITGTGGFTKAGLGSLVLSGSNNYTGGTVVNQGSASFGSSFTMAGSNGFALSGAASPVAGSDYGFIAATSGTFTYGGNLAFSFTGTAVNGATYDLFNISGATLGGSSFSNVSIGGSYTASLTNSSGVWTATTGGFNWTFTESTGDLTIAAVAVPEPSTWAAMAGVLSLGFAAWRRRRAA